MDWKEVIVNVDSGQLEKSITSRSMTMMRTWTRMVAVDIKKTWVI